MPHVHVHELCRCLHDAERSLICQQERDAAEAALLRAELFNVKNEMERQLYKKPRTTAEPAMRAKMISRIVIKAEPVINCIGGHRKNMT